MEKLNVSRKSIGELFSELRTNKFIIPDYQRNYDWDSEQCQILWDDLESFFSENKNNEKEYFLGTIVLCLDKENNFEVIDGQQRITSFFLMLRAFYKKLEGMIEDDDIIGLKSQIEPCIWELNKISKKISNKQNIHLVSKVISDSDKKTLHELIVNGDSHDKNKYSENYNYFYNSCDKFAREEPVSWYSFIVTILDRCIVLPIECPDSEVALTIFSTLNDRGLPLSDSDIFKSQMYNYYKNANKENEFLEKWKELGEKTISAKLYLNDIFRYYSHIIRAKKENSKKEIGLRRFFSENNFEKLKNDKILDDLLDLCDFWIEINHLWTGRHNFLNERAKQYIHCLHRYPNDFWRYLISVFHYVNKEENCEYFQHSFEIFLRKTVAFLFHKFITRPSVVHIKDDIYKNCVSVFHENNKLYFKIEKDFTQDNIKRVMSYKRLQSGLLLLIAYLDESQTKLLPPNFEIEHIFPKKWQDTNYNGWNKDDAKEFLEKLGNKMAIEKKVNIESGNRYFARKKEIYEEKSEIKVVRSISMLPQDDWLKKDIIERDGKIAKEVFDFFEKSLQS